jgi:conjugal transfer pilus assembly protein TraD
MTPETGKEKFFMWLSLFIIGILFLPVTVGGLILYAIQRSLRFPLRYLGGLALILIALGVAIDPIATFVPIFTVPYKLMYSSNHALQTSNPMFANMDFFGLYSPKVQKVFSVGNIIWCSLSVGSLVGFMIAVIQRTAVPPIKTKEQKEREKARIESPMNQWAVERAEKKYNEKKPDNGVYLGIDKEIRKPIILSEQELNNHTFLVGTTGSGKTTTILTFVEYAITKGYPVLFVDGKGIDRDLPGKIENLSRKYGKTFRHFSFQSDSVHYNPLVLGGYTELKDKLISITDFSEAYYKGRSERYLQMMFKILKLSGMNIDLLNLVPYLIPDRLRMLSRNLKVSEAEYNAILDVLDSFDDNHEIKSIVDKIALFCESEIGHLFSEEDSSIHLHEVFANGEVALFSLNSLSYPEFARQVGRLIISDVKTAVPWYVHQGYRKPPLVVFDEFNVFASRTVVDLINKSRSAGFCALIATQSLADIDVVDPALRRQIIENCNTVIIQRQNEADDAEALANAIGTENTYQLTFQTDANSISGYTGMGSARNVKEFIVHPDEIKRLRTGEAIILRKIPEFKVQRAKVRVIDL